MNTQATIEAILETIMTEDGAIKSPYGLYGYPLMWDLLTYEGRIMAVRPAKAQTRAGHRYEETKGFSWGWHVDGAWQPGEQHMVSTQEHLAEGLALLFSDGAKPVAPALVRLIQAEQDSSPAL